MMGRRPIIEDVPEMTAATAAVNFSPDHAVTAVNGILHRALERRGETRPARSAFEFLLRNEELLATTGAHKGACPFFVIERTAARPLGPMAAQHRILLRGQELAPLLIGMGDFKLFRTMGIVRHIGHGSLPDRKSAGFGGLLICQL
jgi:hypothetical protein